MTDAAIPQSVVALSRVCVEFDGHCVVENVDLAIAAGEFVAVLGPNGSGKSTLVRAMLGLEQTSHGQVRLFGSPLADFREWQRIALVPQSLPASTSVPVSIWETVLAGLAGKQRRWHRLSPADRDALLEALETVGLSDRRGERLHTLSGGQQRRVLIARALAQNPDLLVLDEPSAGLDAENLEVLMLVLEKLHQAGKTIVVITHDLEDFGDLVTRAVVLGKDREASVRYDGPPPVPASFDEHVHHHHERAPRTGIIGMEA